MRSAWKLARTFALWVPLAASGQDAQLQDETGITVRGRLPSCRALASDPLEAVDYGKAGAAQQVIKPDPATGTLGFHPDDNPYTAPGHWDRAGVHLGDYVYRAPTDTLPGCIGGMKKRPRGFGQLRRVLPGTPLRGKSVRFTALVATRRSDEVRFWLAGGDSIRVLQGDDTANQPLWGTHGGWIPVNLLMGPVRSDVTTVSYGFLLMGSGVVWVHQPRIEILDTPKQDGKAPALNRERRPDPLH